MCAHLAVCSGIVSAGGREDSSLGSSSRPELEPLFELPRRNTLLALLTNRERPGDLSPEPPAPPVAGELMTGGRLFRSNGDALTRMTQQ